MWGRLVAIKEPALDLHGDRRLARGGQARQQHRRPALVDCQPTLVAVKRRWVPGDVATVLPAGLDDPGRLDDPSADGVVGVLVDQDERAGDAIERVWIGDNGRARAQRHLADVVECERGWLDLALERLRIGALADALNRRTHSAAGVLQRVAPADVQRVLAHPADRAVKLPRG